MGDFDDNGMTETTVTEEGALSQIGSSFKNMLAGLVCFIVAWPVLFCGANRIQWQKVFTDAVQVEQAKEGKPVFITGTAEAPQIGDQPYLAFGNYLKIDKTPEVYAYVEKKESESKTKRKGITRKKVTKTTKTYDYELQWTADPPKISSFKQDKWRLFAERNRIYHNKQNPLPAGKSETISATSCKVGDYEIDIKSASLYASKELDPVYIRGVKGASRFGDKRIRYTVSPSNIEYTFAGSLSGKKIVPYYESDDESKLAGAPGDKQFLINNLKSEDKMKFWLFFIGGFLLMAIGLNLLAGPVTTLLEFIPVLGTLGAGVIRVVLTIVALILSAVFYFLVKYWWLVLIIVGVVVILIIALKKMKAKPAPAAA